MQNKNRSVTAREQRLRSYAAEYGCVITGDTPQIHHLFGSSAKVKTPDGTLHIGEIASLPMCEWWHMHKENKANLDEFPRAFEEAIGKTQKQLWLEFILGWDEITDEEINAVMNYSKSNRSFGFDIDEYRKTNELPELLRVA